MRTRARCSYFVLALASGMPLRAQASDTIHGTIVDAAGKPAAATVHARTVSPFGIGPHQQVAVEAAADGTFALPASLGTRVLAFAAAAAAATPIVEVPVDGNFVLRLGPAATAELRVEGIEAWRAEGPLRAFVLLPAATAWSLPIPLDGRGAGRLPPLPAGELELELRGGDDAVVWRQRLARLPITVAQVPPPLALPLRVVDEGGKPLAGAAVEHRFDDRESLRAAPHAIAPSWSGRVVARTDADGRAMLRIPQLTETRADQRAFCGTIVVQAAGRAAARVVWDGADGVRGNGEVDGDCVLITVPDANPFVVTLTHRGEPFAGRRVLLFARQSSLAQDGEGFVFDTLPWHGEGDTDAAGRARFPAMPPGSSELRLVPIAQGSERLPPVLALRESSGQELSLDAPTSLDVVVRTAGGAPCRGMRVLVMPSPDDIVSLDPHGCEPAASTGADGAAHFALAKGRYWVYAADGEQVAHGMVAIDADPVTLQLEARPLVTWRVRVERGGKPAGGACLHYHGQCWNEAVPIPDPQTLLPIQWLSHFDYLQAAAGTADADGWLTVRFASLHVGWSLAKIKAGPTSRVMTEEMRLDPSKLPASIVLR